MKKSIKYLYCLISTPKDIYYEQAFISITSLRMHNHNAFVSLFTDRETINSVHSRKSDIKKIVDEIVVEDFENSVSNLKRSRILKTIMRNRIDGDFLYIDSDTVICQDLSEIEKFEFDFGAVLDRHKLISFNSRKFEITILLKKIFNKTYFYKYPHYFNSGLLFVKDTKFNRDFFKKWNDNYLFGCYKGIPQDQPSLALTNYQLEFPIKELYGKWNVQGWDGVNYLHSSKIMHYFANYGDDIKYEPFANVLPLKLKEAGYLTETDLRLIAEPRDFFGEPAFIIVGKDYEIYCSSVFRFIRKLYRYKFLFKLIDSMFILPRIIYSRLSLSKFSKKSLKKRGKKNVPK